LHAKNRQVHKHAEGARRIRMAYGNSRDTVTSSRRDPTIRIELEGKIKQSMGEWGNWGGFIEGSFFRESHL
jgi:hypothetical protein